MEKNDIKMLDFLSMNFKVDWLDPDLQIWRAFLIEEKHLCRPDLLSYEAYNNVNYADILMKFNQITNPFSLEINDIVLAPSLSAAVRYYREDKLQSSKIINDTKALFIDPKKASKKDIARLEQLQKIAKKRSNGSTEIKPTNLLRDGEIPYSTDGKAITFAPSSSVTGSNFQATSENS